MEGFRQFTGEPVVDLKDYIKNWVSKNPYSKIYLGCDSQRIKHKTVYAIVICFYNEGKGAHVIYKKEHFHVAIDFFTRLWGEVERMVQLSVWIQEELNWDASLSPERKRIEIHLDLNPSAKFKSNQVYNAGLGYAKGCGFVVKAKPDGFAASCAADCLLK